MSHSLSVQGITPEDETSDSSTASTDATPSGGQAVINWVVVAQTGGLMPAAILAGRLQTEGIPARYWGVGDTFGLTVGILGTGNVAVPEEFADAALDILNDETMSEEE